MNRIDYFYFIIDVSTSMQGRKIGAVNDALNNIIFMLKKRIISQGVIGKVMQLTYSDKAVWVNEIPENIDSFVYNDVTVSEIGSNLGNVFKTLNEKLNRQYESCGDVDYVTTVILFTDGLVTDDYNDNLDMLKDNPVFKNSNRIGLSFSSELSEDIAKNVLKDFCDNENSIIVDDFIKLNKVIFDRYR